MSHHHVATGTAPIQRRTAIPYQLSKVVFILEIETSWLHRAGGIETVDLGFIVELELVISRSVYDAELVGSNAVRLQ